MDIKIRKFIINDWKHISEIYRQGIETGNATFETAVPSWVEWDRSHLNSCRLIAEADKEVLGWAALSPVSQRDVYKGVADISLYVSHSHKMKGIGRKLLAALIEESEKRGIWTLQASIFPKNTASIRLHLSCGFRKVGLREKIGKLGGKWKDTLIFERRSKIAGTK
jgi:phosphinothricin acetyltransferase